MESYWQQFRNEKSIFLEFRPSKRARVKADKYEREALQEAESVPDRGAQRQRRMQREQARISKEKQAIFEKERGFNFTKFHLPLHTAMYRGSQQKERRHMYK
jgi:hypothetical protein